MGKFTKGFWRAGSSLAVLGIVLLVIGFCMGGRPQGLSIGWDNGLVLRRTAIGTSATPGTAVTVPPVDAQSIRSLVVDIDAASVEIRTGSAFSLDVSGQPYYTSTVESNVWVLSTAKTAFNVNVFGTSEPRFVVTVPADFLFESISLNIGAGMLQAKGLHAQEANVSVGAGSIKLFDFFVDGDTMIDVGMGELTLNGALRGSNNIRCGMGVAKMLVERPADYGYDVNCGMGVVKIDGSSTGGMGSEMAQNQNADTFYSIDCGMGTVKVEFPGTSGNTALPDAPDAPEPPEAPDAPEPPAFPGAAAGTGR